MNQDQSPDQIQDQVQPRGSATYEAGRSLGWFLAGCFEMTKSYGRLRTDVDAYEGQLNDYMKQSHPKATVLEVDAARHCFVSAKMTQKYGRPYAAFMGQVNEVARDVTFTNNQFDRGMDLHNNRVGRSLSPKNSDAELLAEVWGKVKDGTLITSHQDTRPVMRNYRDDAEVVCGRMFEPGRKLSNRIKKLKGKKKKPGLLQI